MDPKDNPLLQPEDFLKDYRDNIESLKNNPNLLSFEKLCYELFGMNESGKKFMEIVRERYLLPSLVNRDSANYQLLVIWADGFKDFARMLQQNVTSHEQRIKAGMNE